MFGYGTGELGNTLEPSSCKTSSQTGSEHKEQVKHAIPILGENKQETLLGLNLVLNKK